MKSVIIGSYAQHHHDPKFREPKDFDVLISPEHQAQFKEEFADYSPLRFEPAWYGPSSEWIHAHSEAIASEEILYTIKAAQLKFDVFWQKTAFDDVYYQRRNIQLIDELFRLCLKDFTELHGKRWAKLEGKNSKTFFEDAVKRKYVHDSIHEAVAYYDHPLYESILTGEGVMCSKEKFYDLSLDDQIKLAKEEIFVTALERFLIPENFTMSARRAYWLSLKKFVTTMSSGWMSRFLIDNFHLLDHNTDDYVGKFHENSVKLILNEP